jgi:hypothetical protein
MTSLLSLLLIISVSMNSFADETKLKMTFDDTPTWNNFDKFMHEAELQDKQIGWSYLASGILVTAGGTLGAQYATDDATKVVYGLIGALGIGASAYGLERVYNGNNYTAFYQSIQGASLTDVQRSELVSRFMEFEKAKEARKKKIAMISNYVMSGLNLYSATQEPDKNTKNFFFALAAINFGLGLSYSF